MLHEGKLMWPPPTPKDPSPAVAPKPTAPAKVLPPEPNYFNLTLKDSLMYTTGKKLFLY